MVTGGGGGIGLDVAKGFAEAGADVAIWYNSNKKAIERAEGIAKKYGVKCQAYQCQVTDSNHVTEIVNKVYKDFGNKLDIVVVNHGIPSTTSVLEGGIKEWEKVVNVDFNGAFYAARAVGEIFQKQKSGNLIFTARWVNSGMFDLI
jgi:sorbose reductase